MFSTMSPIRKWLRRHGLSRTEPVKSQHDCSPKETCLPTSSPSGGKCFISLLPDELLIEIFDYLMPQASIQHVCQRWNRLSDHLLVRHIDLGSDGWSVPDRIKGLHSKLRRYPELCAHVRSLSIQLNKPDAYHCEAIAPIITLCGALQGVFLHTDWNVYTWPIVLAISELTALKTLSLSGTYRALPLEVVFDYFNQPSLRRLHFDHYCVRDSQPAMIAYPPAELAIRKLPERAGRHTSGVVELTLMNAATTPEASECVVRRSSRLVKLTLKNTWVSPYEERYSADAVQRILDIHRQSLTYIDLGLTLRTDYFVPNFCAYPCLRVLRLSAHAFLDTVPETLSRRLSTPSLQHLILAYTTHSRQDTKSWHRHPEVSCQWLYDFATLHVASDGTNLCSIMIDFTPDFLSYSDLDPDLIWHWECLIELKNPLSKHGLTFGSKMPVSTSEK